MNEEMIFPDTLDEFIKQYSFIDKEQIYTNGSELIQTFRVKQWEEHKEKENQALKDKVKELVKYAYGTEMSLGEFKGFYKLATGKEYEPKKGIEVE